MAYDCRVVYAVFSSFKLDIIDLNIYPTLSGNYAGVEPIWEYFSRQKRRNRTRYFDERVHLHRIWRNSGLKYVEFFRWTYFRFRMRLLQNR